jgi:putative protease
MTDLTSSSHKCELAIPAGSLQCALYAFKGGADAVYLGMKSFSARKGAVNFSFEDVRKLKAYCASNGKKFYITLNTIVNDREMTEVIPILRQLEYIQPDGIIVQDLGIAKVMRKYFPSLPLHGSTQLAVHTINGVKELQNLGFSRIVLSRELSFDEIKEIREACPDVELKIFIHGALCYGFSGLCMASQCITGRSANRGACAQICRTWFSCKETDSDSWLFSMKDLCLGDLVKRYVEIGIDSMKVEGRMKGPDYAYWTARYYSLLLEGKTERDQEVQWAKEAMQVSFSRETTTGFFPTGKAGSTGSQNMVSSADPGHRGILVGKIDKVLASKAIIRFTKPVAVRDGLKVVSGSQSASFSLSHIDGGKSFISEGETATINFPTSEFERKPGFGTPVYCISRHNLNMALLNENIPLFKRPVDITVEIKASSLSFNGFECQMEVQEAKNPSDLTSIFTKVLEASDKSHFTLGKLTVNNKSGIEHPFLPMSVLKQARRDFYDKLDNEFTETLDAMIPAIATNLPAAMANNDLPSRKELGLWGTIVEIGNERYLPLSPLMFNENQEIEKLEVLLKDNPDLIVGLNNIAQVLWAKRHPETGFFADVFLYTENSEAYSNLKSELPNLIGSYELDEDTPFNFVGDFKPPLFISRVCMRHHGLGLSCKDCSRNNTYHLEQNGHKYIASCKDCITVVQSC